MKKIMIQKEQASLIKSLNAVVKILTTENKNLNNKVDSLKNHLISLGVSENEINL